MGVISVTVREQVSIELPHLAIDRSERVNLCSSCC